jgi:hypothetical protein
MPAYRRTARALMLVKQLRAAKVKRISRADEVIEL